MTTDERNAARGKSKPFALWHRVSGFRWVLLCRCGSLEDAALLMQRYTYPGAYFAGASDKPPGDGAKPGRVIVIKPKTFTRARRRGKPAVLLEPHG